MHKKLEGGKECFDTILAFMQMPHLTADLSAGRELSDL
jgi:hypothetical protein